MRILALDFGEKRTGVAISDPTWVLASPVGSLYSVDMNSLVEKVLNLAIEKEVCEIVVGMPFSMSGRRGEQAGRVSAFVKALVTRTDIPVETVDERMSSIQAERMLRESGMKPSRNKDRVDAAAAAVLLQSYLDSKASNTVTCGNAN